MISLAGILSGEQELVGRVVTDVRDRRQVARAAAGPLAGLADAQELHASDGRDHLDAPTVAARFRRSLQAAADLDRARPPPAHPAGVARQMACAARAAGVVRRSATGCAARAPMHQAGARHAIRECSLALAIDGMVHTNLLKRLDIAQERYQRAIAANPNNSLAWLLKGTLHAFTDEGSQAVHDTELALKLSPLDPHRYYYEFVWRRPPTSQQVITTGRSSSRESSLRANRSHTSTLRVMTVAQWQLGRRKRSSADGQGTHEAGTWADDRQVSRTHAKRILRNRKTNCQSTSSGRHTGLKAQSIRSRKKDGDHEQS